jgi:putative endonuclease
MLDRQYYVYLLTNFTNKVPYTGVTNDLPRRIEQHRAGTADSFTKKYRVWKLVYYEVANDIEAAIEREKAIKGGSRARKEALINSFNPTWRDLAQEL